VVGTSGPAPSRWTLRTIRASVDWLTDYTLSGVWRGVGGRGGGGASSCGRLFFPDSPLPPQVGRVHRRLRGAAPRPDAAVAAVLDISAGGRLRPGGEWRGRWPQGRGTISNGAPSVHSTP